MSKRDRPTEGEERPPKRQRQEPQQPPQVEEIHFARQLQDFLVFRQDGIQQLRNGIASFKAFLESILYHKEEDNRGRQISILREYLETQKPADGQDIERPFLPQLWQAWSFAVQNNNDHLASSVSAILALLLKTLSGVLDLRDHGILLCRTALQHQHVRLVKRCLEAPKHKDFVISPSLRLLTEVSSFDGGVLAREVYKRREQTFDVSMLRRNLGLVKTDITEDEARRKPAIRTLTLRYVLSLIKYLHEGGKIDILKNRPLCNALFQYVRDDPSDAVNELLSTIEQSVLKNSEVPRSSKATLLTPQTLERVTEIGCTETAEHPAADRAFTWLTAVCKTSTYGIFRHSGWYPPGTTKFEEKRPGAIDLGLDSVQFYDGQNSTNVRNSTLLSWALTLRAHVNERERKLLMSCFAAAPELVSAYFAEKTMQLEPKLTNTWIAYASLMFEIVSLPVPEHLGGEGEWASLPPQTTILIENVLPRPLTQAILTRCLNQASELITFFTLRILVVATEKLGSISKQLRIQATKSENGLWDQAADRLLQRFLDRSPTMKDVIALFRKLPDDEGHAMQREAVVRLLRLYYEVIPSQALEEQFDVSAALTAALTRSETEDGRTGTQLRALRSIELEHLLTIAGHSSGMRWLHKQGSLQFSPLTTLLRIHCREVGNRRVRSLLQNVFLEQGILLPGKRSDVPTPFDALLASLLHIDSDSEVWIFFDDCITRASKKPIKYLDDLEAIAAAIKPAEPEASLQIPSILTAVFLEQAPFVAADHKAGQGKADWINLCLDLLDSTSDTGEPLCHLKKSVKKTKGWQSHTSPRNVSALLDQVVLQQEAESPAVGSQEPEDASSTPVHSFAAPPTEPQSHPEFLRWSQKEVEVAIDDGDVDALILCLCSEYSDVRRQAFTELRKLYATLCAKPALENGSQISLLIGELLETFEQQHLPNISPLSYLAGAFAVRALHVLMQPQHFIYPKLNRFLIRGPEWRVSRLPTYWLSITALGLPEEDDAYWREVQWVLDWLVDGVRGTADMDTLRKGSVFEKVLALWTSPGASSHKLIRERILELLFRTTCIQGGSDTLITRVGILSWIHTVSKTSADTAAVQAIRSRIIESCDQDRIATWSGGAIL